MDATFADDMSDPPLNRMAVSILALIGVFVCFYLLAHHLGWVGTLVCGVGDCAAVQASPYAKVGPIPVAAIGLSGYTALLVLSLLGVQPRWADSRTIGALLVAGAAFGVAYAAYLTYLEAVVIHAWCQWCVISAIDITLILIATLPEMRRMRATEEPT